MIKGTALLAWGKSGLSSAPQIERKRDFGEGK